MKVYFHSVGSLSLKNILFLVRKYSFEVAFGFNSPAYPTTVYCVGQLSSGGVVINTLHSHSIRETWNSLQFISAFTAMEGECLNCVFKITQSRDNCRFYYKAFSKTLFASNIPILWGNKIAHLHFLSWSYVYTSGA